MGVPQHSSRIQLTLAKTGSRIGETGVRKVWTIVLLALLAVGAFAPVEARDRLADPSIYADQLPVDESLYDQLAQQDQDTGIPPSEAAAIARDQVPGAKVVGVKLLSNGWYAVTLRAKGSVTRVMVNAQDGSVR
jgi:uncharacterized membrane protein YkoI